ncbi:MAG: lipoyl synthase [bacterium]
MSENNSVSLQKPSWLKVRVPAAGSGGVRDTVTQNNLHTVCEEAHCPNKSECWSRGTATFLILGATCTRNCAFCAVRSGQPEAVDKSEPRRILNAVEKMGLTYLVITSVTRDDLQDGGAGHWCRTLELLREELPELKIEVLVPDFAGNREAWRAVFEMRPDVFNHNIETVARLYEQVRSGADYWRSLDFLRAAAAEGLATKSGVMLGMGEKHQEVEATLKQLFASGVESLTLGQYLAPSTDHHPVQRWVRPEEFSDWKEKALSIGFKHVESAPFVRSSYHAEENPAAWI